MTTLKDELMQRLKYEQQMQNYNNRKQALQNATTSASQAALDNSGSYIEGATGSKTADSGIDAASTAAAATGTPVGLAAAAAMQLAKGAMKYVNAGKNASMARAQKGLAETQSANQSDLSEKKSNMGNLGLQNMNRLATMQNTGTTQQSITDMLNTALSAQPSYSIGDSYADKAQRGIENTGGNVELAQQEADTKKGIAVDTAKNVASTVAGGMSGAGGAGGSAETAASGAGDAITSTAGNTAANEIGANAGSALGDVSKDVSGEILNYNYDMSENVSNLSDYRSGGIKYTCRHPNSSK